LTKSETADADPGTLVYDGECSFCVASARRLKVPSASRQELGLTEADTHGAAMWIGEDGRRSHGHLAIAHALAASGGWRGICGRVLLVPPFRWAAAAVYPFVARNRHRLRG
jgi:predicted DCC family thiol-disulfide oxidoreductase YuxK